MIRAKRGALKLGLRRRLLRLPEHGLPSFLGAFHRHDHAFEVGQIGGVVGLAGQGDEDGAAVVGAYVPGLDLDKVIATLQSLFRQFGPSTKAISRLVLLRAAATKSVEARRAQRPAK